ncbi:MAG: hypothetical protein HQK96_01610 [Nitrospirae bacterium]|nr:hypothetical protein [Nitrospirota bacterium]
MKKYKDVTTLPKAIRIISEQDRMIGALTRERNSLVDTEARRKQWLDMAKGEAGADLRESFNTVWCRTLQKAKLYDEKTAR